MTTVETLMAELEALGTAQARKIYANHGASEPMFGVSFANLEKLRKKIKVNHPLAVGLWQTGNHDARILATMIADSQALSREEAEQMGQDLKDYGSAGLLAKMLAQTPFADELSAHWRETGNEWTQFAGWQMLSHALQEPRDWPENDLEDILQAIESRIHTAPNYARLAINSALISLGLLGGLWETRALEAAQRIGKVNVDHGKTSCKTPDAAAYILKTKNHRLKKEAAKNKA